jgi:ABC-type nitrate/sulfonate/bicarbonate transport system permease component
MPKENTHFAEIILGFLLGTAVATIISFFYGSSKSSKDKTESMKGLMK